MTPILHALFSNICFKSNDWLYVSPFTRLIKLKCTMKISTVRDRKRLHIKFFRLLYKMIRLSKTLEKGIVCMEMEVGEGQKKCMKCMTCWMCMT